jgi:predicted DNA-binding protein with PD1-like motif
VTLALAKIYSLHRGSNFVDEVLKIADAERIMTARVEAIGGVNRLTLGYFDSGKKKHEEHAYNEFLEVACMLGNITMKEGKPFLHVHGTFGRRDMSALSGHVISATVFPTMELVITPTSNRALRKFDEETGLNVISRTQG